MRADRACAAKRVGVALLVLLAGVAEARGPAFDGLTCFKIKDSIKRKSTEADASTAQWARLAGCRMSKSKVLCLPSDATFTGANGPSVGVVGLEIPGARLCYKLKCPGAALPDPLVTDPFGTRTLTKTKAQLLCMPATTSAPVGIAGLDHLALGRASVEASGVPPDEQLLLSGVLRKWVDGLTTDVSGAGANQHWSARVRDDVGGAFPAGSELSVILRALIDRAGTPEHGDVMVAVMRVYGPGDPHYGSIHVRGWDPSVKTPMEATATVTCRGVLQNTSSKPSGMAGSAWSWSVDVPPDLFEIDLPVGAGARAVAFGWSGGCGPIVNPNDSQTILGDRLVISMPSGADVLTPIAVIITGEELQRLAIGEEGVKQGPISNK